jgi:tetratricopeptide (TPR) repeat protein
LMVRGHFYARLAHWDKAAADLTKALELGSDDMVGIWCSLAVLHLGAGRMDEYRSLCERLMKRFGRTESHWLVATGCLARNAVSDVSRLVQTAEKLLAREPKNADYIATLGLALYRKGDVKGAIQRMQECFQSGSKLSEEHMPKLILAMAYHRSGRATAAQQLFQEVTQWMKENDQEKRREGPGSRGALPWPMRLALEHLYREAEEVLKQDCDPKSPSRITP